MIIYADENSFEKVINSKEICLVDFYATWCGPCRLLNEEFLKLENNETFNIVKIDIDECPNLADEYAIEVVPTMYVFKNGKSVQKLTGYLTKEAILKVINNHI